MKTQEVIEQEIIELIRSQDEPIETPAYIYSVDQVVSNYNDLRHELGTPLIVSVKANHCPELLARSGYAFMDGYEVASLGELRLRAGTKQKIYVNSPAFTIKLVDVVSRYNAVFIIDHPSQLNILKTVGQKRRFANGVLLRVNFDALTKEGGERAEDHFGMDEAALREAVSIAKDFDIRVSGLHVFCGSNGFIKKQAQCVISIEKLYDSVVEMLGYECEMLNLGGGIPAGWRELDIDFAAYRERLRPLKKKVNVVHESGRAIFGSAGYFVAEALSTKQINNHSYVICDGGIAQNFLLSKTEQVIRRYDNPVVINGQVSSQKRDYIFVGASCNRDDVIGELKSTTASIHPGDKIMFRNCGAYNALYTVNKFLALPEYKEYIV